LYAHVLENLDIKSNEEQRLRVFENRVLRRIFGPKREEVAGGWGRLHNEGFHNFYSSPNIIRVIKSGKMIWTGHVARMHTKSFVGKYEIRDHLGHKSHTLEDNSKMDLKEMKYENVKWVHMAEDRVQWRFL
jgi:hypothetical protein